MASRVYGRNATSPSNPAILANSIIYLVNICVKERWQGRYDSRAG